MGATVLARAVATGRPTRRPFVVATARARARARRDPGIRLREIGDHMGNTERAAHRVVGDLADAGDVSRERHGRRNRYTINAHLTLPDPVARRQRVGDLLAVLTEAGSEPISQAGRP
jgi:hypothetical protein